MSLPDDGPRSRRRGRDGPPGPHPEQPYDDGPYGWGETPGRDAPRWEPPVEPAEPAGPPRRSRIAVTALVLGVLAIPLCFTIYIGALIGLVGLILGIAALTITRGGRRAGRAMAVTGTVCGLIGLTMSVALGAYGIKTYRDCQQRLGHKPTSAEVRDCTRSLAPAPIPR